MTQLEQQREEKRAEILRLAQLHGCRNVRVFGSVASGENQPGSDVDFRRFTFLRRGTPAPRDFADCEGLRVL